MLPAVLPMFGCVFFFAPALGFSRIFLKLKSLCTESTVPKLLGGRSAASETMLTEPCRPALPVPPWRRDGFKARPRR